MRSAPTAGSAALNTAWFGNGKCSNVHSTVTRARGEVVPTPGITVIGAPGAAAAAVMPGVRSTPGLPRGGDARGAARGQLDLGEISAKPHLYERCISVSVVLPA